MTEDLVAILYGRVIVAPIGADWCRLVPIVDDPYRVIAFSQLEL